MENASELKSCPFCGDPTTPPHNIYANTTKDPRWSISCSSHCISMTRKKRKDVIKDWNTRNQSPESSELVPLNEKAIIEMVEPCGCCMEGYVSDKDGNYIQNSCGCHGSEIILDKNKFKEFCSKFGQPATPAKEVSFKRIEEIITNEKYKGDLGLAKAIHNLIYQKES